MYKNDTIASISTAPGIGAIGIVRISGTEAFRIAGAIFKSREKDFNRIATHTVSYGKIVDPLTGIVVDEVLLSKMNGPRTYTTEDIVEINCHGGTAVIRKILNLVCKLGARVAEPGEFTKRAFLHGRIDLSQAEAVIDVINSRADESLKACLDQLEGKLSKGIRPVRDRLIGLLSHIEALVDYPEYDIEEVSFAKVLEDAEYVKNQLEVISDSFEKGRIIREGLNIVIIGRPNVGKSSLLNSFSGQERAIVTDVPGTTRDIIEEYIEIGGVPVNLIDTAGIRETTDIVENMGVLRSQKYIEKADLVLFMLDATDGITDDDRRVYEKLKNKRVVVLINKIESAAKESILEIEKEFIGSEIIKISVIEDFGIDKIERYVRENFLEGSISMNNEVLLTNARHKKQIDLAIISIEEVKNSLKVAMPLDIITIDIKNCAQHLGNITGESVSEDVLKEIFSRFCIGK